MRGKVVKGTGCADVKWTELDQGVALWPVLVNTVMNIWDS